MLHHLVSVLASSTIRATVAGPACPGGPSFQHGRYSDHEKAIHADCIYPWKGHGELNLVENFSDLIWNSGFLVLYCFLGLRMKMKLWTVFPRAKSKSLFCAAILSLPTFGLAQYSYNIDLDSGVGSAESGNGAPSNSFGAAADQPGLWNRVNCVSDGPSNLFDLSGTNRGVFMTVDDAGSGGGSGWAGNSGDYALLLNDYATIRSPMTYRVTGLETGSYKIFTYAVNASGHSVGVNVSVDESSDPLQVVTGPMPGDRFEYLVTHSIHYVSDLRGDLIIRLSGPWPRSQVNGFQIVAVPEPATMSIVFAGTMWLACRRRTSRSA